MRVVRAAMVAGCACLAGCGAGSHGSKSGSTASGNEAEATRAGQDGRKVEAPREVARPKGKLTRAEAEKYILDLINRDRAVEGLPALEWDDTAARAGQVHADDMVLNGYTAHWGSDGSVPELRYTEVGGQHMVQENAGCFADGKPRELDPDPRFDAAAIEKVEAAFFHEQPPNDGHRKNILKRWHTHVGVGLAKAKGVEVVCQAQEFTDHYGSYDSLPTTAKVGQKLTIRGTVDPPAKFVGVGIARTTLAPPHKGPELLKTGTYPIPAPFVTYFPKGFVTPIPVTVEGRRFEIEAPLSDHGKKGLYQVSIWGEVPGTSDFVMVSLRTIRVQ